MNILNGSASSGTMPGYFLKNVLIQPLLQKPNFGPISKLPPSAKVPEKIAENKLLPVMNGNLSEILLESTRATLNWCISESWPKLYFTDRTF